MREKTYHLYLNEEERSRVIQSLIKLKNNLAAQGRYTDAVDDVLCSAWELPPYLTLIVTSTVRSFSPRIEANKSPVLAFGTFVTNRLI